MKAKGESTYTLINNYGISGATIHRLRHNLGLTTTTLDDLCKILDCKVGDVIEYVKDEE